MSRAKRKLTEAAVRDLPQPAVGEHVEWDRDVRGFGVRCRKDSKRLFVKFVSPVTGQQRKVNLGSWPTVGVEQARKRAREILQAVSAGRDPVAEGEAARAEPTVADLAAEYLRRAALTKRPKSLRGDRDYVERRIGPALGAVKVRLVTRKQVEDLHLSLAGKPYAANRMLACLSAMMGCAVDWGWRADNPCAGVRRFDEHPRETWLSDEELARLWAVLDGHPNQRAARAFKLAILTSARIGEVLSAEWRQFDLDRAVWTKPAAAVKQRREHKVPLAPQAVALLRRMREERQEASPFLFPGDAIGKPLRTVKTAWHTFCRDAGLEGVRIHDLRHTSVSLLVNSGVGLHLAGRLAGHRQSRTTERYAHTADSALRDASARLGSLVEGITTAAETTRDGESGAEEG